MPSYVVKIASKSAPDQVRGYNIYYSDDEENAKARAIYQWEIRNGAEPYIISNVSRIEECL